MLHVERRDATIVWTIDRPNARNALDHATIRALIEAVEQAHQDTSIRAGVLTSTGTTFVSGGDLRELRDKNSVRDAEAFSDLGYDLCRAIEELPFPTLCAMPGPAIGGGVELALACDVRIADERVTLSLKQVRMGVTTAWGTIPRLLSLVSHGTAARLLYVGHSVTAAEALRLGLVDDVTPDGHATTTALSWARDVAEGSPVAVQRMKHLVRTTLRADVDVRALERESFAQTWSGDDHREAVEAYFERRSPRWRAR